MKKNQGISSMRHFIICIFFTIAFCCGTASEGIGKYSIFELDNTQNDNNKINEFLNTSNENILVQTYDEDEMMVNENRLNESDIDLNLVVSSDPFTPETDVFSTWYPDLDGGELAFSSIYDNINGPFFRYVGNFQVNYGDVCSRYIKCLSAQSLHLYADLFTDDVVKVVNNTTQANSRETLFKQMKESRILSGGNFLNVCLQSAKTLDRLNYEIVYDITFKYFTHHVKATLLCTEREKIQHINLTYTSSKLLLF